MSRQCLPPVDEGAVKIALRAIRKVEKDPIKALRFGLTTEQKRALRAGQSITVKRDSKLARYIIERLLPAIDEGHNKARRKKLEDALRAAFGEKAYKEAEHFLSSCARMKIAPDLRGVEFWGKGLWIAPYRSANGLFILVALDEHGQIAFTAEITGARSGLFGTKGEEFTANDGPDVTFDAGKEIAEGAEFADYSEKPLPRGVHIMPWHPWHHHQGAFLVATDEQGCLVASTTSSERESDLRTARRDLSALLDLLSPAKYVDRYLADDEGDDLDLGEEWKRDG